MGDSSSVVLQWQSGWNGNLAHENHGEAWVALPGGWHKRRYYTSGWQEAILYQQRQAGTSRGVWWVHTVPHTVVAPRQVPDGHTPAMICAHTTESVSYVHINTVVMCLSTISSMSYMQLLYCKADRLSASHVICTLCVCCPPSTILSPHIEGTRSLDRDKPTGRRT